MSREIEMKVQFTPDELDRILSVVSNANYDEAAFVKKSDKYYTDAASDEEIKSELSSGGKVVRIRTEGILSKNSVKYLLADTTRNDILSVGNKSFFATKIKEIKDGFENNVENELLIHNPNTMDACLHDMGYRCWFEKTKFSYGVQFNRNNNVYHVEIERVSTKRDYDVKFVWYVEIENVDSTDDTDETAIINDEKAIFEELGLDPNKVDNRPWVEILRMI
jgi:adenylate cyclase class IV